MEFPSLEQMLEAGLHFGHQTRRWDPKMKQYIFGERNGIHIIDLLKTQRLLQEALKITQKVAEEGKIILFVGTKRQAKDVIRREAERIGVPHVTERWLGGTLTNFKTIRRSMTRLEELERLEQDGPPRTMTKKEMMMLLKERVKLEKVLMGVRHMTELPGLVFVVDCKKERIAVAEANKLNIPVVAIVDTNIDPDLIDFPIPGNDDAMKSVKLITRVLAQSVEAGKIKFEANTELQEKIKADREAREKAAKAEQRHGGRSRDRDRDRGGSQRRRPSSRSKTERKPREGRPIRAKSDITEKAPVVEKKAEKAPAAEKKAVKAPPAEKKAEKAPPAEKKAEKAPAAEKKAEKAPAVEKKAEKAPPAEKKAEKVPPAEKKVEKAPAAEKKAEKATETEKKTKKASAADKKDEKTLETKKKPDKASTENTGSDSE